MLPFPAFLRSFRLPLRITSQPPCSSTRDTVMERLMCMHAARTDHHHLSINTPLSTLGFHEFFSSFLACFIPRPFGTPHVSFQLLFHPLLSFSFTLLFLLFLSVYVACFHYLTLHCSSFKLSRIVCHPASSLPLLHRSRQAFPILLPPPCI